MITWNEVVAESRLDSVAEKAGSLYFCSDTGNVFLDSEIYNKRIQISKDIIFINTEADREALLAPIPIKLYIVKESDKIYFYDGVWHDIVGTNGTDATLSMQGMAADAKAVGDALAELKANNYASLSEAITDANNNTFDNAIVDGDNAKVKAFIADNGKKTIMLLDDCEETTQIDINKNIDIILNGHTLSFTSAAAYLNITEGVECTIDGEIDGSAIIKECDSSASDAIMLITAAGGLIVKKGNYKLTGNFASSAVAFRITETCHILDIDGCKINVKNTTSSSDKNTFCIHLASGFSATGFLKNSIVNIDTIGGLEIVAVRVSSGMMNIENTFITTEASATAEGIVISDSGEVKVNNSKIFVNSSNKRSFAIYIMDNCKLHIENSEVLADAPGDNSTEEYAYGILNVGGIVFCKNTNIAATMTAFSNGDTAASSHATECYVEGGIFTGYSYGGFYFAHGIDGIAYINDAVIRCGHYSGIHTDIFAGDTVSPLGSFYIGGGTGDPYNNMKIYLDGCTIGEPGYPAFTFRGASGEINNVVNLSNSTIVDGSGKIRIDNETFKVNIGVGTNITEDMIGNPACAEFTDELYRRCYGDKVCNGNDYKALANFINNASPLPKYTADDNGKFLRVADGVVVWQSIKNAEEDKF